MPTALPEPQRSAVRTALGEQIGHEEAGILIDLFPSEPPPPVVTVDVLDDRVHHLSVQFEERLGATQQILAERIDHQVALVQGVLAERIDQRTALVQGVLTNRIDALDAKIDATAQHLDAKIDAVPGRVTVSILVWLVPVLTLYLAALAGLVAFVR